MSEESTLGCGMDTRVGSISDMCGKARCGRWSCGWLGTLVLVVWWLGAGMAVEAASAKISKVLPHLVDREGRHTLSPSLYERDAYQARLREQPGEVGGLRFDVRWSVSRDLAEGLRLRIELRGTGEAEVIQFERPVERRPWYDRWSEVRLDDATYARLGRLIAWRVSLWRGPQMIAEQRSFLW
ncbi:MAG: hypothetical protein KJ072_15300 [Verrucomicrobia bacterium]|nr:hypothetical protein [Verrucomicrobiota bacterium]